MKFDTLYNFKAIATSLLGYKDTEEARKKMIWFFKDKNNHLWFFGSLVKTNKLLLALISKPGGIKYYVG